mmetsp:Transcript_65047/g.178487  ORF Transcript_65047/g.178487 Transcript_65047/m.178487 type:complete len:301 (+) Transcript_65047:1067-1969(+)
MLEGRWHEVLLCQLLQYNGRVAVVAGDGGGAGLGWRQLLRERGERRDERMDLALVLHKVARLRRLLADSARPHRRLLRQVVRVGHVLRVFREHVAEDVLVAHRRPRDTQQKVERIAAGAVGVRDGVRRAPVAAAAAVGRARRLLWRRGGGGLVERRVGVARLEELLGALPAVRGARLHQRFEHDPLGDGVRPHLHHLSVERHLDRLVAQHLVEVRQQVGRLDLAEVLISLAVVPRDRMLLCLRHRARRALLKVLEDRLDRREPAVVLPVAEALPLGRAATQPVVDAILGGDPHGQVAEPL